MIIIPLALVRARVPPVFGLSDTLHLQCAVALFIARENIEAYLDGRLDPLLALDSTPNSGLVFQAKILSVEKVLYDWRSSPHSHFEYLLLRHRLLEILADVVRPGDDYIGYDLVGPVFSTADADHYAYDESFTARDHARRGFVEPLVTRAPTILESCEFLPPLKVAPSLILFASAYLSSSRSRESVISLLRENGEQI